MVIGHTHMPFDRLADTRRIVNPGSVGLPYGRPGAAWALLGPDVILRRTAYNTAAAAKALSASASDLPDIEFITGDITTRASVSDAEALAAFNQTIEHQARQRQTPMSSTTQLPRSGRFRKPIPRTEQCAEHINAK